MSTRIVIGTFIRSVSFSASLFLSLHVSLFVRVFTLVCVCVREKMWETYVNMI